LIALVEEVFGLAAIVEPLPGLRQFGVPVGGSFDTESAAIANVLMGLPQDAPILELALGSITLRPSEPTTVAVVGRCDVVVDGITRVGSRRITVRESLQVRVRGGCRAYVAARWRGPSPLSKGDQVPLTGANRPEAALAPATRHDGVLRVVPGPQADLLDTDTLLGRAWRASHVMDRVGIRLDGPKETHQIEIPSEPSCMGAIQITRDGTPIILGPDGPTIGGYPKVAVVIEADWPTLAQIRPGEPVSFESVSWSQASELRRQASSSRERLLQELRLGLV